MYFSHHVPRIIHTVVTDDDVNYAELVQLLTPGKTISSTFQAVKCYRTQVPGAPAR